MAREILPQTAQNDQYCLVWKEEDEEVRVYGCSSSDQVSVVEITRAKRGLALAKKRCWAEGWKQDQDLSPVSEATALVCG